MAAARTCLVDANVVLSFLDGRPEGQARAAEALFAKAARGELEIWVHPAVMAEVVYVATSRYGLALDRKHMADVVARFLVMDGIVADGREAVLQALAIYAASSLDWVDALLLAHLDQRQVFTFDAEMIARGASQLA